MKVPHVKQNEPITASGENKVREAINTLIGAIGGPQAIESAADPEETPSSDFPIITLETKETTEIEFPIYDTSDPPVQVATGVYVATVALIYNVDGVTIRIETS